MDGGAFTTGERRVCCLEAEAFGERVTVHGEVFANVELGDFPDGFCVGCEGDVQAACHVLSVDNDLS